MKAYLKKLIIFAFILGAIPNYYAQVEEDSVATELDELLNISVEEEDYVSSASKYDQTPEEAPSSISIITAKDIQAFGYQTLTDLLNAQRGFYYSNDRSTDQIGVRGFGRSSDRNNRILLLLDGHRLNPYQVDYAPIGQVAGFNLANFERIEIVRGPGSTLYGNNAIHGVINMITKKDVDSFIPTLNLKYGSFNKKYLSLRSSKQVSEDFSFSVLGNYYHDDGENLYFSEFDTPENNNGIVNNQNGMKYNGVIAAINFKDFKLTGMIKDNEQQIATAPYSTKFNEKQSQYGETQFLDFSWSPQISYNKFLIFNLSYDHHKYGSKLPFRFISNPIEFVGNTDAIGADVQYIWDFLPNNRLITGIEYRDNFNSSYKYFTGDVVFVDDQWSYKLFSIFFQNEYQYNADLSLYFGLRRDDFVNQEVSYNPRAGIVYSPFNNHTLKLLYGRSFRAPNLVERNLEERNIVGVKKNESLKSEFINTYELIWSHKISENFTSHLSFYHYKLSDLIDQIEDPIDDLLQYVNIGEVTANGLEAELNYNFKNASSYFRYSYQSAEDKLGNKLTNSPEHLIKFGLNSKLFSILNGSIEFNYETERKTIFNEFTKPIFLGNANLYTDRILDYFSISLGINNIFNQTIKHPGGFELVQKSIIQPYRNYLLTLNLEF